MALATLTEYKATAGITTTDATRDAALTQILLQAQARMETLCGREVAGFETATWTERVEGDETAILRLSHWPVTSITSITAYGTDGSTSVVDATAYRTKPYAQNRGWVFRLGETHGRFGVDEYDMPIMGEMFGPSPAWTWGRANYSVVYVGGYTTVPQDLKAVLYWLTSQMYADRAGSAIKSETISGGGTYSYTRSDRKEIQRELLDMLQPWREAV